MDSELSRGRSGIKSTRRDSIWDMQEWSPGASQEQWDRCLRQLVPWLYRLQRLPSGWGSPSGGKDSPCWGSMGAR